MNAAWRQEAADPQIKPLDYIHHHCDMLLTY